MTISARPSTAASDGRSSSTRYTRRSVRASEPHGNRVLAEPCQSATATEPSRLLTHCPGKTSPSNDTPGAGRNGVAGGKDAGAPAAGTTGIETVDAASPPVSTVAVIAYGVGQIIGHIALDTARRNRCPGSNVHDDTCRSNSKRS